MSAKRESPPIPKPVKKARRTVATSPALAKEKATRLHSLIVRSKGVCEGCGYECPCGDKWPYHHAQDVCRLQCAHIVSRRFGPTRTDETNAFCACSTCHRRWTEWPLEFTDFVYEKIGLERYLALKAKSESKKKMDWPAEYERLASLWRAIGG